MQNAHLLDTLHRTFMCGSDTPISDVTLNKDCHHD